MSVINGGTVMNKRVLLTWTSILVIKSFRVFIVEGEQR